MGPFYRWLPWIVAAALVAAGMTIPIIGPRAFGLSPTDNATLSGALGGALVGAAAALFATLVMDLRQQLNTEMEATARRENVMKLVAAELVDVAMGMMASKRTMDIAIETVRGGGSLPATENFARDMPRSMNFTRDLGAELLVLDAAQLDAIVTLKANMVRTGEGMEEISSGRRQFGLLTAQQLSAALSHDMGLLAECFERLAPERKFKLRADKAPELASEILRRFAQQSMAQEKIGL